MFKYRTNKSSNHVCNEDNIKSAELVKKETKPCPNCASRISKLMDVMKCFALHVILHLVGIQALL